MHVLRDILCPVFVNAVSPNSRIAMGWPNHQLLRHSISTKILQKPDLGSRDSNSNR